MQYEEVSWYSNRIKQHMRVKVYGHYGISILVFPSLYKQSDDFYNNGVIDALEDYINEGKIKLFCVDSIDDLSITSPSWDKNHRAYLLNQYHEYIINEVLPFIYGRNKGYCEPIVLGCSMGASHAAINFFRRPELFSGILAISGRYDIQNAFFEGYVNDDIYNNSPSLFLSNMDNLHYYINIYNSKRMIFTVGKGSWEHLVFDSNIEFKSILNNKGINAWYDVLDESYIHDWISWIRIIRDYIHYFI